MQINIPKGEKELKESHYTGLKRLQHFRSLNMQKIAVMTGLQDLTVLICLSTCITVGLGKLVIVLGGHPSK